MYGISTINMYRRLVFFSHFAHNKRLDSTIVTFYLSRNVHELTRHLGMWIFLLFFYCCFLLLPQRFGFYSLTKLVVLDINIAVRYRTYNIQTFFCFVSSHFCAWLFFWYSSALILNKRSQFRVIEHNKLHSAEQRQPTIIYIEIFLARIVFLLLFSCCFNSAHLAVVHLRLLVLFFIPISSDMFE